jgi:7-carboxy-7-deazaguanine synthase
MTQIKLPVVETFRAIQGEGPEAGTPTTFLRVAGCNMIPKCNFCDSAFSWLPNMQILRLDVNELANALRNTSHITVTGGEPVLYDVSLGKLYDILDNETHISVETNGLTQTKVPYDTIVISPKKQKVNLEALTNYAGMQNTYFKFVYERGKDLWWEEVISKTGIPLDRVYIMPQGRTTQDQLRMMPEVIDYCLKQNFKFSPRLHVLAFNERRGV